MSQRSIFETNEMIYKNDSSVKILFLTYNYNAPILSTKLKNKNENDSSKIPDSTSSERFCPMAHRHIIKSRIDKLPLT